MVEVTRLGLIGHGEGASVGLLKKGPYDNPRVTELRLPGLNYALQITKETAGFEASLSPNILIDIQDWLKAR